MPSTSNPPDSRAVLQLLEKLLASDAFSNAPRAQQFLRFVVEESLAGRASELREPVVAASMFHLGGNFDRRKSSIVRAEATHVRRRLREYQSGAGASDPVIIDLPRGGYVPIIRTAAGGGNQPRGGRWTRLAAWVSLFRPGRFIP